MEHKGTNYYNVGGTLLYTEQFTVMITTTRGYNIYDTGGYTPVARMTYDRIKHTAHVLSLIHIFNDYSPREMGLVFVQRRSWCAYRYPNSRVRQ